VCPATCNHNGRRDSLAAVPLVHLAVGIAVLVEVHVGIFNPAEVQVLARVQRILARGGPIHMISGVMLAPANLVCDTVTDLFIPARRWPCLCMTHMRA
jgi:hypothetical protein